MMARRHPQYNSLLYASAQTATLATLSSAFLLYKTPKTPLTMGIGAAFGLMALTSLDKMLDVMKARREARSCCYRGCPSSAK